MTLTKDEIRETQMLLNGQGFGPLKVDGIWGTKTEESVMAFQRSKGLMDDGIVGDKTRAAFRAAKGEASSTPGEASDRQPPAPVAQPHVSGLTLTANMLRRIAPNAKSELVDAIVGNVAMLYAGGITSKLRLAHFIAQICTETGGLRQLSESLNYSVEGLLNTFGRHRISEADARRYGRNGSRPANQEAIANLIYGGDFGRKQLGNTESGDGWRFRGGGYLQNTGRGNYRKAGFENDPETLRDPINGLKAALEFWKRRDVNHFADNDNIVGVRKIINGGTNGLEEARDYLVRAKSVIF